MLRALKPAGLLSGVMLLTACGPSLEGRFEDVKDPSRFYTFTSWGHEWANHYGEDGTYDIDGTQLMIEGAGITGEVISPDEIRLNDVSSWSSDVQFNTYRRRSE